MAKVQTRRTVSLTRNFYDRLRAHCEASGESMAQFVEQRLDPVLALHGRPATSRG